MTQDVLDEAGLTAEAADVAPIADGGAGEDLDGDVLQVRVSRAR